MKIERTGLLKKTILGEYVRLKCDKCGAWNSTFTHSKYFFVDCECTLNELGSKWRTINLPDKPIPTLMKRELASREGEDNINIYGKQ